MGDYKPKSKNAWRDAGKGDYPRTEYSKEDKIRFNKIFYGSDERTDRKN